MLFLGVSLALFQWPLHNRAAAPLAPSLGIEVTGCLYSRRARVKHSFPVPQSGGQKNWDHSEKPPVGRTSELSLLSSPAVFCPPHPSPNPQALFSLYPQALFSPYRRCPFQLFHHHPTHLLAGGSPSPPSLFSMLGRDPEAQHSSLHRRYGWQQEEGKGHACLWGVPPSRRPIFIGELL